MDAIFNKFFDLIDNLPIAFQAVALLILSLMIISYQLFSNKKVQRSIVLKIQKKLGYLTKDDLKAHNLFSRKDVYQNFINSIYFKSDNKTRIFRKILSVKLANDLILCADFVENVPFLEMNKNKLCNLMISEVNNIVRVYESDVLESLQRCYDNEKGTQLFDLVMNSPGGFREKRVDRLNRIIFQVDEFLRESQIFDNNIERVEYYLTEILYALRTSIFEAEKMFTGLNGEIDAIIDTDD